jgi:TolA-binding protein
MPMFIPLHLREIFEEQKRQQKQEQERRERWEREIKELEQRKQAKKEWQNRVRERRAPETMEQGSGSLEGEVEAPTIDAKYSKLSPTNEGPTIKKSEKKLALFTKPDIKKSSSHYEPPEPGIKANKKPQHEWFK